MECDRLTVTVTIIKSGRVLYLLLLPGLKVKVGHLVVLRVRNWGMHYVLTKMEL